MAIHAHAQQGMSGGAKPPPTNSTIQKLQLQIPESQDVQMMGVASQELGWGGEHARR